MIKHHFYVQAVSAVFVSVFFRSQLGETFHPGTQVLNPELPNRCPPETPRFSGVPTRASAKTWLQLKQFYHPEIRGKIYHKLKNCQPSTKTPIFSFLFTTEIEVFLVFFCLKVHKLSSPNCRQQGIRLFVQFLQPRSWSKL